MTEEQKPAAADKKAPLHPSGTTDEELAAFLGEAAPDKASARKALEAKLELLDERLAHYREALHSTTERAAVEDLLRHLLADRKACLKNLKDLGG